MTWLSVAARSGARQGSRGVMIWRLGAPSGEWWRLQRVVKVAAEMPVPGWSGGD